MQQPNMLQRYSLIITKMVQEKYPSFNKLESYLAEYNFEISPRTLQRTIEQIREGFGIEIKYNKTENGYYIEKKDKINISAFLNILNHAAVSDVLVNKLKEQKLPLACIKFAEESNSNIPANINCIVTALSAKKVLRITYKKNQEAKEKLVIIHPYQLQEIAGFWYLIAWAPEKTGMRVYNLEKLTSVEILNEKYKVNTILNESILSETMVNPQDISDEIEKGIKATLKGLSKP